MVMVVDCGCIFPAKKNDRPFTVTCICSRGLSKAVGMDSLFFFFTKINWAIMRWPPMSFPKIFFFANKRTISSKRFAAVDEMIIDAGTNGRAKEHVLHFFHFYSLMRTYSIHTICCFLRLFASHARVKHSIQAIHLLNSSISWISSSDVISFWI